MRGRISLLIFLILLSAQLYPELSDHVRILKAKCVGCYRFMNISNFDVTVELLVSGNTENVFTIPHDGAVDVNINTIIHTHSMAFRFYLTNISMYWGGKGGPQQCLIGFYKIDGIKFITIKEK